VKRFPVQKEGSIVAEQFADKAGRTDRSDRLGRMSIPLFFFSFFFIFLLRYIDPVVIYSSNGISIHTHVAIMHSPKALSSKDLLYRHLLILELTPTYLREIANAPGGWTRLAATLCIYACHYPIAGAFVVTGLALFFFWIFPIFIQGMGARRPIVLSFVPAFFIITVCAWYELSFCVFLLPIAGALAFAVFYQRLRPPTVLTTVLWQSVLFWLAWYFMQWGCLLLLLFITIHELFSKERKIAAATLSAAGNGALLFAVDSWFIPLNMTIRWNDFMMQSGLPLAAIGFFPLAAIILAATSRFWRAPEGKVKAIGAVLGISLLVCGTAFAAVWLCKDPVNRDTRIIARTAYHVMSGQWEAVLHEKTASFFAGFPQTAGPLQVFMVHAVDHALWRTGGLGDKLFTFPQAGFSNDPLLMLRSLSVQSYVNWIVVLDLAMDLGMLNTAEKVAGELMENMGPYPEIIYRRALIQVAKGNKEAAAIYLGRLAFMPFYRAEAKRFLRMLDNKEALFSEPRIAAMRANKDTVDYLLDNDLSCDGLLKDLLKSNPHNKAAYDYLMTFYLLNGRLDEVAALAPAAPTFGYTVLPRCWDEALCLYQAAISPQGSSGPHFSGLRQETIDRFNAFSRAWSQVGNDPEVASKLAPAFGDSYFYFSGFRYSPGALHE
jgi:hypothetical protein